MTTEFEHPALQLIEEPIARNTSSHHIAGLGLGEHTILFLAHGKFPYKENEIMLQFASPTPDGTMIQRYIRRRTGDADTVNTSTGILWLLRSDASFMIEMVIKPGLILHNALLVVRSHD